MRRALKITAAAAGAVVLSVVVLCGAIYTAGMSARGRAMIERVTYALTSGRVRLSGLGGSWPSQLTLAGLELSDRSGVWLTAKNISMRWAPLDLLWRTVHIERLHADHVLLARLPVSAANAERTHRAIPRIVVTNGSIDSLELGPNLAGRPAALVVRGGISMRSAEDLQAQVEAERIGGDGRYRLRLAFDPKRMDAALEVHEPAGGPLESIVGLPNLGALAATMTLKGARTTEDFDLKVDAGGLRARAHGSANLPGRSADFAYSIEAPAMRPRADLAWGRIDSSGHWRGAIGAPSADGKLDISDLRVGAGFALRALHLELSARGDVLAVHGGATGLQVPGVDPALLARDPLGIDAAMRLTSAGRPLEFALTHRLFSIRGRAVTTANRSMTAAIALPDVAPFAALAHRDIGGNARVNLDLAWANAGVSILADADAAHLSGPEAWLKPIGERVSMRLAATLGAHDIAVSTMRITGRAWSLSLDGDARRRSSADAPRQSAGAYGRLGGYVASLKARWRLDVHDLAVVSPALAGSLTMSGAAEGPPDALAGNARLVSNFTWRGSAAAALTADVHTRGWPSAMSGSLLVGGKFDAAPVKLALDWHPDREARTLAVIRRANWKSVRLDGAMTVGAAAAQSRGRIQLSIADLADLDHLVGIAMHGSLAASTTFAPVGGRPHAQLQCAVRDMRVGGIAANAQLSGAGPLDALALRIAAQLPNLPGGPAALSSTVTWNSATRALRFTDAALEYRGQTAHSLSPAVLSFADGVSLDNLRFGARNAVFELAGRIAPDLDLRASLRKVTPAFVDAMAPGLLSGGTIEASATLHGKIGATLGTVTLDATGLRVGGRAALGLPAVDLHGTAELHGAAASIDARMNAGRSSALTLTGDAPLQAGGALDLKIGGKLDLALVSPMLEAHGLSARGAVSVAATVTGATGTPQIAGVMQIAGGHLRDYGRGVNLENINARMVGDPDGAKIESFEATAAPGSISMTGTVGLFKPKIPLDLTIVAKNARPIVSNLVTASLDANLHVGGTALERIDVAGTVNLRRTVIGIPKAMPPNVAVLDVRRRGTAPAPPALKPLIVGLNVTLSAPSQILVRGRGLDAELGGELHLAGTSDTPQVSGGFDLQHGSFSLAGTRLSFTSGRVSFNGAGLRHKIDPMLDFTAQTATTDGTTTLRITGLADALRFDLTSTPPRPPDEIMARLLFGANAAQLSPLQAAQLGAAFATLSGVGGNGELNPLVKLQRILGLDRLTVGTAESAGATPGAAPSGTSIAAGRYISSRVYVEAKQTTTGSSQVQVNVDLTKHLKLQTRLGNGTAITQGTTPENDPGSSIGLSYTFEY